MALALPLINYNTHYSDYLHRHHNNHTLATPPDPNVIVLFPPWIECQHAHHTLGTIKPGFLRALPQTVRWEMITIFLAYGGLHEKVIARFGEISCSEREIQGGREGGRGKERGMEE